MKITLCRYDRNWLELARLKVLEILKASNTPNPPRIPGEKQCKYCRAKAHCPEARNTAMTAFDAPEQSVALLTPDELGDYLGRIALVETVIDALKSEAKSRLEKGEQVTGWKLKPGAEKSTVTDPQALFNRFSARGGTVPQFMAAITVTKGKFKDAFKAVSGLKGNDLGKAVESMMDGIVEIKTSAPSLEKGERLKI